MEEKKDLQQGLPAAEETLPAAKVPAEQIPLENSAAFEPVIAPATDDPLSFINEQINDNWLNDFLQKKQTEEVAAQALTADKIIDEQVAAEGSAVIVPAELDLLAQKPEEEEKEIGLDMAAAAAAGLVAPEDRELESILAENWGDPEPEQEEEIPAAPTSPQEAFPVEEEMPVALGEEPEEAPAAALQEEIPEEADLDSYEEEEIVVLDQKKRRPKMNIDSGFGGLVHSLPHLLVTVIWVAIIVMIAVPLGRLLWLGVSDVMAFGKEPREATVTIDADDTAEDIANKLGEAELVRYPRLFQKFAELTHKAERVDPGTYTLNAYLDYNAMLRNMASRSPAREVVTVMFPEGYNCAQIFAKLEENGVCTVAELEAYAANGELDEYWFLEDVERGHKYCLEGYLAPDTYKFYTNDDPGRVLEKFLNAFEARFTDKMRDDLVKMQERYAKALAKNGYSQTYIESHPLTLHNIVTLASIVQKETANDNESYTIASVFYNRLADPNDHPYLGSDATVYYAIGDYFMESGELTAEAINFDSPYNTRHNRGLPPGPICNPGAYSLYAVLEPDETNFYYFIYSPKAGGHLFSSTLKEHQQKAKELGY